MIQIAVAVLSAFLSDVGMLDAGRCGACKRWGVTSTVTMEATGACTAMFCGSGHYDENGKFQPAKPCNTCTFGGRCSRGHQVIYVVKM